jgi:hypothetical protein
MAEKWTLFLEQQDFGAGWLKSGLSFWNSKTSVPLVFKSQKKKQNGTTIDRKRGPCSPLSIPQRVSSKGITGTWRRNKNVTSESGS